MKERVAEIIRKLGYEVSVVGDSVLYTVANDNGTINRVVEIDCSKKASRCKIDNTWFDWDYWTDDEWEFEWEE